MIWYLPGAERFFFSWNGSGYPLECANRCALPLRVFWCILAHFPKQASLDQNLSHKRYDYTYTITLTTHFADYMPKLFSPWAWNSDFCIKMAIFSRTNKKSLATITTSIKTILCHTYLPETILTQVPCLECNPRTLEFLRLRLSGIQAYNKTQAYGKNSQKHGYKNNTNAILLIIITLLYLFNIHFNQTFYIVPSFVNFDVTVTECTLFWIWNTKKTTPSLVRQTFTEHKNTFYNTICTLNHFFPAYFHKSNPPSTRTRPFQEFTV